jgi:hypothetical protein
MFFSVRSSASAVDLHPPIVLRKAIGYPDNLSLMIKSPTGLFHTCLASSPGTPGSSEKSSSVALTRISLVPEEVTIHTSPV